MKSGVVIEEFIDGPEYAIDTIWNNGEALISGISCRNMETGPYFPDRLYYIDSNKDLNTRDEILQFSFKAVKATGVKNGATHTEIRFMNGKYYALETTSRPGGAGTLYEFLYKPGWGVDFLKILYLQITCNSKLADYCEGISEKFEQKPICNLLYTYKFLKQGVIERFVGLDKVKSMPETTTILCYKKPGDYLYYEHLNIGYAIFVFGKILDFKAFDDIQKLIDIYQSEIVIIIKENHNEKSFIQK